MVDSEIISLYLPVLDVFTGTINPSSCYQKGQRFYTDEDEEVSLVNLGNEAAYVRKDDLRKDPALGLYFSFHEGTIAGKSYESIMKLKENYGFSPNFLLNALRLKGIQQSNEEYREERG